jgi:hypothetical protein
MYTLSFQLRQHTPLIHFQHELNATLRATELKPKLDKYLWKKIEQSFPEGTPKETLKKTILAKYKPWITPTTRTTQATERFSFNYKVSIKAKGVEIKKIEKDSKDILFFFGNMGDEYNEHPKFTSFTDEPVNVQFSTLTGDIIDELSMVGLIKKWFPSFLLIQTFGTRQNKGFGSFYIHEKDKGNYQKPELVISEMSKKYDFLPYKFTITPKQGRTAYEQSIHVLNDLSVFYKAMRSGINSYNKSGAVCYLKSMLWTYFREIHRPDSFKWEKKKIKEKFFSADLKKQQGDHSADPDYADSPLALGSSNEVLIKDLFGLASTETWKARYNATIKKKVTSPKMISEKNKEGEIDRFSSPIFFKPINNMDGSFTIYMDASEIDQRFLGAEVNIEHHSKFDMRVATSFDFYEFFAYLQDYYILDEHFIISKPDPVTAQTYKEENNDRAPSIPEYQIISKILNQLQASR